MARGDVVNDIQDIATGASLTFQPGAGVEVMITEVGSEAVTGTGPDKTPDVTVYLYDGSLSSIIRSSGGDGATLWGNPLKLFINNTNYLRIVNQDAGTKAISYSGIQTK